MGRVQDKIALVTGGASGLGKADAKMLAAEGARVIITDLDPKGAAVAEEIGHGCLFLQHDVCDEARWQEVLDAVKRQFGGLDILVNNAGIVAMADPEQTTLAEFRKVNAVMSEGVFLGCKYAIPLMRQSGGGSIVNMSSVASHLGYPIFFAYSAAKGAVRAMTKSIAVHCQAHDMKIRCNSIHAGAIETPMVQQAEGRAGMSKDIPKGVLPADAVGAPEDVAYMVTYLASDESRFVTGAEFIIDNGLLVR